MKILKHDIDVKTWKYTLICYCCTTELEVVMDDIKYRGEAGDWHDSGWETYTVNCPECSTELTIAADQIHNLVKVKIQKKSRGFFS